MSRYFTPYEGAEPYVFVSYSHRDSDAVLDVITRLREGCWRIWYDEGIPAGSDWPRNIADHMAGCSAVLFFWSGTAKASPNCASEIRTAERLGKPVVWVALDDAVADGEWEGLSAAAAHVARAGDAGRQAELVLAEDAWDERVLGSEGDYDRAHGVTSDGSRWNIVTIATFALLMASVAAFVGLATGLIVVPGPDSEGRAEPESPVATTQVVDLSQYGGLFASEVVFPDATQERAVRQALGVRADIAVNYERLVDISTLFLCGNIGASGMDVVAFDADGTCRVHGAPVIVGEVSDLSVIAQMPYLTELALVEQPVDDLSGLAGLAVLRELWLGGSGQVDLSTLPALPSLEAVHLEHTGVSDLSALYDQPALSRVYVSADMLPLHVSDDASFALVLTR